MLAGCRHRQQLLTPDLCCWSQRTWPECIYRWIKFRSQLYGRACSIYLTSRELPLKRIAPVGIKPPKPHFFSILFYFCLFYNYFGLSWKYYCCHIYKNTFYLRLQLTIPILIHLINLIIFSVNQFVYKMSENRKEKNAYHGFQRLRWRFSIISFCPIKQSKPQKYLVYI